MLNLNNNNTIPSLNKTVIVTPIIITLKKVFDQG